MADIQIVSDVINRFVSDTVGKDPVQYGEVMDDG